MTIRPLVVLAALAACMLGFGGSRQGSAAISSDHGIFEAFVPQSATTWWAIVQSNLRAKTFVVRTSDGGRRWRDVTPPVRLISSSDFH